MKSKLDDVFKGLIIGISYSYKELRERFDRFGFTEVDINNLTYNRWNTDITLNDIKNLSFKWNKNGKYTYLGNNFAFCGITFLYKNARRIGVVGVWVDGQFSFFITGIESFEQWINSGYKRITVTDKQ